MYGNLHKHFLQAMMSRAIVSKTTAIDLLAQTSRLVDNSREKVTAKELNEALDEINRKISGFGMELKEIISELDSEVFIVLINVTDDSSILEKIDHIYTVKEREVFRLLLEGVVRHERYGFIPSMEAINLIPNMRPGDVQDVIDKLILDKWFEEIDGRLLPAPRCLAEFDLYFKKNFHDHVQLCICSNVVFFGVLCPHCDSICHKHCFKQYNNRKDGQEFKCPTCKEIVACDTRASPDETPEQRQRERPRQARKGRTPDTPQNTPAPTTQVNSSLSQEYATPGPSRSRRKRPSSD